MNRVGKAVVLRIRNKGRIRKVTIDGLIARMEQGNRRTNAD